MLRIYKVKYIVTEENGSRVDCSRKVSGPRMIEALQTFIDRFPESFLISIEFTGDHTNDHVNLFP